jgi:hypothetical protein
VGSLQLVLGRGFTGDAVQVELNGRVVVDEPSVTTKSQVDIALMRDVPADGASAQVTVAIPSRRATSSFTVSLADTASVDISLTSEGAITHRTSRQIARVL